MLMNSQKLIPGTNGEMTEHDLYVLLTQLEENNNFEYAATLPQCERGINTLIMIKKGTREELIERNRQLYKAREWEKYI
ncbi:MAG: hypothetical protein SPF17_07980 [Candidatus Mucispirillum faecigallinarum]|nr:hypothetical protein [Candidatus Mucispirillum faecigallinarum]